MTELLELVVTGAGYGAAYALIALSINIIYASTNILNFAQGEFAMLGGILGWVFYSTAGLPYALVVGIVLLILAGVGAFEYRLVVAPLAKRRSDVIYVMIATLGFGIVVKIGTAIGAGGVERFARPPLGEAPYEIFGITVIPQVVLLLLGTAIAMVILWLTFTRTTVGAALRASAYEPDGARLVGINVSAVSGTTFSVGAALAGLAGLLLSPLSFASPWAGLDLAILGFGAAILGGLGSWPGAVVGGLVLGVGRAVLLRYVSAEWGTLIVFAVILLVLYVRPTGLYGEKAAAAAGTV